MVKDIDDHRKEKQSARHQFEIFSDIISCNGNNIVIKDKDTDEPIIEMYDSDNNKIVEINYSKKEVISEDQALKDQISELLEIHHHSNLA